MRSRTGSTPSTDPDRRLGAIRPLRIGGLARRDIRHVLRASRETWGAEAAARYRAVVAAALSRVAADPSGGAVQRRPEAGDGVLTFHLRHVRNAAAPPVRRPAHVLFCRIASDGAVEVLRLLHERMDPGPRVAGALRGDPSE